MYHLNNINNIMRKVQMGAKKMFETYRPSREFSNGVRKIREAFHQLNVDAPTDVKEALESILEEMIEGKDVSLKVSGKPLTTQEAADILQVSRSHLIKLLDAEDIPSYRVGAHRRIVLEDLLTYKEHWNRQRLKIMSELTALSQEIEEK